jgi:hypothetical protein
VSADPASVALERALEISRELLALADAGDVKAAVSLDARRLELIKFARAAAQPMRGDGRRLLREIAELNDRALGFLEHRRRAKARDLDMATVGLRAVRAYAATRMGR